MLDLVSGVTVTCEERDRDRYGRIVARCKAGGFDVGANMVHTGWALSDRQYAADYVAVEAKARDAKRELWKGEFVPPWDWRRGERLSDSGTSVDPAVSAVCCKICRKGKACGNSCNAKWMTAFSLLGDHVMADQVRLNAQKEAAANATTTAKFRSSHNHRCLQQFRLLLPPIRRYARHLA